MTPDPGGDREAGTGGQRWEGPGRGHTDGAGRSGRIPGLTFGDGKIGSRDGEGVTVEVQGVESERGRSGCPPPPPRTPRAGSAVNALRGVACVGCRERLPSSSVEFSRG